MKSLREYFGGTLASRKSTTPLNEPHPEVVPKVVLEIGKSGIILTSLVSFRIVEARRSKIILINIRHPAPVPKCMRWSEHRWLTVAYYDRDMIADQLDEFYGSVER